MSITLTIPDAEFSHYFTQAGYPKKDNLDYLHYFGGSASESTANLGLLNNSGLNVIGSPEFHDGYATLDRANHFETENTYSEQKITFIIAVRSLDLSRYNAGTYTELDKTGFILHRQTSSGISYYNAMVADNAEVSASLFIHHESNLADNFTFVALTYDGDTLVNYSIEGGLVSKLDTSVNVNLPSKKILYGGWTLVGATQHSDYAMAAVYNTALTDEELKLFYAKAKNKLAKRGVVLK